MKRLQKFIKQLPEWVVLVSVWAALSVIPLMLFNNRWQQLGSMKAAVQASGPLFLALGAVAAVVAFLYYEDDLE